MPAARSPVIRQLPSHAAVVGELVDAERGDGWMARCADAGTYVALSEPFVEALAAVLRPLVADGGPVLEVCAGNGALAAALRDAGVAVIATDASPAPGAAGVEVRPAHEALAVHQPRVVLGAFVPYDARVDEAVLRHGSVRDYVVLNARLGGALGAACLWSEAGWDRERLDAVGRWMVSRHDAWMGDGAPIRHCGEAWRLRRTPRSFYDTAATPQELQ